MNAAEVEIRTMRDGANVYMAFSVPDDSQLLPGSMSLTGGERIIIQFDPDNAAGSDLNNDYRIELVHKWDVPQGFSETLFYDSQPSSFGTCTSEWQPRSSFPSTIQTGHMFDGSGNMYTVELQVPLGEIGGPSGPVGVAMAVVNDTGISDGGVNTYYATATSAPSDLPFNNAQNGLANPVAPAQSCTGAWYQPSEWATGYFNQPPGEITIDRNPVWWNSDAVVARPCDDMNLPSYEFYPGDPCELYVESTLDYSMISTSRDVNLLYLWGEHGAGTVDWTFIALERESIPAGSGVTSAFNSGSYDFDAPPVPSVTGHPCVRVYILPGTLSASFDRAAIENTSAPNYIADLEAAYSITQSKHMAQKNISRAAAGASCPDGCGIAGLFDNWELDDTESFADASVGVLSPGAPQSSMRTYRATPSSSSWFGSSSLWYGGIALLVVGVGVAWAGKPARTATMWLILPAGLLLVLAACEEDLNQPGEDDITPEPIHLSDEEMDQFGKTNAIVQTRATGSAVNIPDNTDSTSYVFVEEIGGVIDLVPENLLLEQREVPIALTVTNPLQYDQRMVLQTTLQSTDALRREGELSIDLTLPGDNVMRSGETRTVRGVLRFEPNPEPDKTGGIQGRVLEGQTGDPVPGVNVVIEGTQRGATSNAQGGFSFSSIDAGAYTLQISFTGFPTQTVEAVVEAGETTQVVVRLQQDRITVPQDTIRPGDPTRGGSPTSGEN